MPNYVVMGVAGCGKSSVGTAFAARIGAVFLDGDDLHGEANIAKMARGEPLSDADRHPWLDRVGAALRAGSGSTVIGCSALKRSYRDRIRAAAGGPVVFVHLDGSRELIGARMAARTGHFMPTSLLDSQFAALERPTDDENAWIASIDQPLDDLVSALAARAEATAAPPLATQGAG
ncbi:gluconokinase [Antarcticirhabdus aurantiaca]|uniref:Gluconokinase n=1 Tax=Antarcticirhabdus aurantiaca TaxID=2606717 RepID=A0ACD4NSX3_9HYPH|nr:gluconokinase [Antarcticirhabdus aurantiaca]WAJ29946.1 gluconokinase [Jeongeuplla avenae]